MDINQIGSWVVSAVGIVGFLLAGKKVWWAWYVNIANQVLWTVFSIVTQQWGFLVATAFYIVIFIRNAYLWTKEHNADRKSRPDDREYAQQPVKNRVEATVRPDNAFPKPPSEPDTEQQEAYALKELNISFSEDGSTISIRGIYRDSYIHFRERHGRWHFGYGSTPNEATHRRVIGGDLRDRLDQNLAIALTKRLAQAYLRDATNG